MWYTESTDTSCSASYHRARNATIEVSDSPGIKVTKGAKKRYVSAGRPCGTTIQCAHYADSQGKIQVRDHANAFLHLL